jgi:hypothetical protein
MVRASSGYFVSTMTLASIDAGAATFPAGACASFDATRLRTGPISIRSELT